MSKENTLPANLALIKLYDGSLENRTQTSCLLINVVGEKLVRNGKNRTLPPTTYFGLLAKKTHGINKTYWIPEYQFRVIQEFCNNFRCGKQSARALSITVSTLKNQKNEIFKRFNIENRKKDFSCGKELRLFLKLLELGIITIGPSVQSNKFEKYAKKAKKSNK